MSMSRQRIATELPTSGRRESLVVALERLWDRTAGSAPTIVEVGTIRGPTTSRCVGDGWATRAFAWYAHHTGGRVTTIDPDRRAIAAAQKVCQRWPVVTFLTAKAEDVIGQFAHIDLLYMDGPPDAVVHFAIWNSLECRPGLVLWDDIVTDGEGRDNDLRHPGPRHGMWQVKGALTIPHMLRDGYRTIYVGQRQALLELPYHR